LEKNDNNNNKVYTSCNKIISIEYKCSKPTDFEEAVFGEYITQKQSIDSIQEILKNFKSLFISLILTDFICFLVDHIRIAEESYVKNSPVFLQTQID
jgi:hypothetical protein